MRILDKAKQKIAQYDEYDRIHANGMYNNYYRRLLASRNGRPCLVEETGEVSDASINVIEETLIAFKMKTLGCINSDFNQKLRKKLGDPNVLLLFRQFSTLNILSPNIQSLRFDAQTLFNHLSVGGNDCLDAQGRQFRVGASKIMNFIFPELFVIMDSHVLKCLNLHGNSFENYWTIMNTCRDELLEWQSTTCDLDALLRIDSSPTTLTRIFDKCAFIMGT
jgi:hypothetical protein